jgi:uncharacterized protein (DUF1501 family)
MRNAALFSALGIAPHFLTRTVEAAATIQGFKDDRVLVVVQLGGGNDGLNTLVPHSDDAYYRVRPRLALKGDRLIRINDDLAFNSRCKGLMQLYDAGQLAIVQGVGYPNPDRSHFRSMEIWHTASDSDEFLGTGWIGRYFDHACSGSARPHAGVALGKERPQAFDGEKGFGVAFEDPRRFGWQAGQGADSPQNFKRLNAPEGNGADTIDFLRHVTSDAILSSREVAQAADRAGLTGGFGGRADLERSLDVVAALIRGNLDTRIYFVSATGFDTHANQLGQHDNLLERVSNALAAFQRRLKADGLSDRVTTMVFSEFGRRVAENGSAGTDHGTAAPMFVVGERVRPGLHGQAPSLSKLVDGDLAHTTDFRGVYASLLENWLGVDSKAVLKGNFAPLGLIA